MSTVRLSFAENPALQPTTELRALAANSARFPFTATTRAAAETWQAACRPALVETLGFLDTPTVDSAPEVLEEVDRGEYIRRKIVIATAPGVRMPLYLLIPKSATGPLPVALAYAGHGYGVYDIVGLWDDGEERWEPEGYHRDFGTELCKRGFLVAAPEIAGFGERKTDYSYLNTELGQPIPTTCHNAATYAFMLGKSLVGMRVRDGMRLIDYLQTVTEADCSRLGAMGISGGGMLTFFHAAVDERIRATVISGYYSSFRESILAMNHCTCNFVPGLLTLGEMTDLVGLLMPRPMLIETGTYDPIFPVATVRESVARAREIGAILGGEPGKVVEVDEFPGRHRINGTRAYDFLWQNLTM
ncbi:MAG: alpha/beta hydrolase family protein [Caldilineaceae bacterium]